MSFASRVARRARPLPSRFPSRRRPRGADTAAGSLRPATGGFSMEDEGALLRAAGAAGVPVAPLVAASNDAAVVGAPFIVVRKLEGETIARRILRDDRFASTLGRLVVGQSAYALARVHAIAPSDVSGLVAQDQLGYARRALRHARADHGSASRVRDSGSDSSNRSRPDARDDVGAARRLPSRQPADRRRRLGRRPSTGSWPIWATRWRTWRGSRSGPGRSAARARWRVWFGRRARRGLRTRQRYVRRPRRIALVEGGRDAAVGRHLHVAGAHPPVGGLAVGRAGRPSAGASARRSTTS